MFLWGTLQNVLERYPFRAFLGLFVVAYVAYGLVTGNWTEDQANNRSCTTVEMAQSGEANFRVCTDNDTGETFTIPGG